MKGANVMVACSKVTAMRPIRKDCSVRKALCVFSAVLSIAATRSQAQDLPCRSDSSLLDSAETASALNDAYASLLDESSLESAHSGLALQAAWEELKQSMPLRPASPVRSRRIGMNKLNRVALARFIGFVEGRLQVKVPDWWEEHLSVAKGKLDEITGLLFLSIPDRGSAPYSVHSATSVPEGIDLKEIDVCVRGNVDVGVEIGRDDIIVHLEEFPLRLDRPRNRSRPGV